MLHFKVTGVVSSRLSSCAHKTVQLETMSIVFAKQRMLLRPNASLIGGELFQPRKLEEPYLNMLPYGSPLHCKTGTALLSYIKEEGYAQHYWQFTTNWNHTLLTTKYSKWKRMTPQKECFDSWQWAQNLDHLSLGDLVWIPYSGKFSLGANFRDFRRLIGNRENKNREKLTRAGQKTLMQLWCRCVRITVSKCEYCVKKMALYHYLQTVDPLPSPRGPLSIQMSPASIQEANKAIRNAPKRSKSRVTYSKFTPE